MMRNIGVICTTVAWIVCIGSPSFAAGETRTLLGTNPDLASGATALMFGRFDEGIRLTKLGLKAPPEFDDRSAALSNLCAGLAGTAKYKQAITYCTRAIEIRDDNWQAYNNRAIAYLGMGRITRAQNDVNQGLELNPESAQLQQVQHLVRINMPRR
jgi:tetratricopeptide (TPR) repeat protein